MPVLPVGSSTGLDIRFCRGRIFNEVEEESWTIR